MPAAIGMTNVEHVLVQERPSSAALVKPLS
jgi:hypothetical protein